MTEEIRRGPGRPPMRPELRDDDPRARAAARAAQILDHDDGLDDAADNFFVDPDTVPDGWSYEWKRDTTFGKEDPAYQVTLARKGWTPVPAERHPAYMPHGHKGKTIERDGMVLMERPAVITERAREQEYRRARNQVSAKEEALGAAPQGQFERQHKGDPLVRVKKTFEHIPIPQE